MRSKVFGEELFPMGAECARPVQNECKEIGHVKGTMTIHWKLSEKCVFERAEK